jgi:hypothetical protein
MESQAPTFLREFFTSIPPFFRLSYFSRRSKLRNWWRENDRENNLGPQQDRLFWILSPSPGLGAYFQFMVKIPKL